MGMRLRHRASLAAVMALALTSAASAKSLDSINYGDELAGGIVTVHFSAIFGTTPLETGSIIGTILADVPDHVGFISAPAFSFSVTGETSSPGAWQITNRTAPAADPSAEYISKVEIDLRPSLGGIYPSLFDDDSFPSSLGSLGGVLGVVPDASSTGPFPSSAVESLPWSDPANLGDMYGMETLTWAGLAMVGPGKDFVWHDDTDLVVPEPASLGFLALGGWALARRRKS